MILTEEQIMIRDMARDFASNELAPHAAEWDKTHKMPIDVLHRMGALGLMGMTVPEQWGGAETDYVSYALALKTHGKKRGIAALCIGGGEATAMAVELI